MAPDLLAALVRAKYNMRDDLDEDCMEMSHFVVEYFGSLCVHSLAFSLVEHTLLDFSCTTVCGYWK